ncbi:unnamed protein product [Cyprideis torosa]|uniref:Beta-sarcoglycan n=1 Tax=Cyprideis torosa TaxID=163714 RepID=A0A7R8WDR6_9CRUS|nr:unnamed protein product [Cyprideis torosa]CAG0892064.1 unnamed protein product [Cyprideis torosa]
MKKIFFEKEPEKGFRSPCGGRARKAYFFWALVLFLFLLSLANLAITIVLYGVLRVSHGMKNLEFLPEQNLLKFYGDVDFNRLIKRDGIIQSFEMEGLTVESIDGSIVFRFQEPSSKGEHASPASAAIYDMAGVPELPPPTEEPPRKRPSETEELYMDSTKVEVRSVGSFLVRDPESGKQVFSTEFPDFGLPEGVRQLEIEAAQTSRISSPIDKSLYIKSGRQTRLKGNEGVHFHAAEQQIVAEKDIYMKAIDGDVVLDGDGKGNSSVSLDMLDVVIVSDTEPNQVGMDQLCICLPSGKIFRVQIPQDNALRDEPITCANAIVDDICASDIDDGSLRG